ncbi:DUF3221 domain-containing protein [Salisediminibacterium selenitireducens]|nr:DUF3221 domain-containing protein [Salisediminibacterium selenitireducens]
MKQIVMLTALMFLGACGTEETGGAPDEDQGMEYGLIGEVIELERHERDDQLGSIRVQGNHEDAMYDDGVVTITTDTAFDPDAFGGFEALETGMEVEVVFDGAAMESHPVQATAAQINVLDQE